MRPDTPPTLPGQAYRATHRASVFSILGDDTPPVRSYGSVFANQDRWTLRFLISEMCEWAKENPSQNLSSGKLNSLVDKANRRYPPPREIIIAATPDELPPRIAMALVGGAYHEAWHSLYSFRSTLRYEQVAGIVLPRWSKLRDWASLQSFLLEWSNIIEDIRIERCGNRTFGGTLPRMHDLQDFILDQEKGIRESEGWTPLSTLAGAFRDAGLGYATAKAQSVFAFYKMKHPDMFKMVVSGAIRPILDEVISLTEEDSLACLRIAMDLAIRIGNLAAKSKPKATQTSCPNCGAPPSQLIVRPNSKTLDQIVICSQCGHTSTSTQSKPSPQGNSGGQQPGEGQKPSLDRPEGKPGEGKPEEGRPGEGQEDKNGVDEDEGGDQGATNQWTEEELAQVLLQLLQQGEKPQIQDFSSAMADMLGERERLRQKHLEKGEQVWSPFSSEEDKILPVSPGSREAANTLLDETRGMTSFLSARLRTLLLAQMISEIEHGHKRGVRLSSRTLVDTRASLKSGEYPNRAFLQEIDGIEISFSAVIVMDQSGSMNNRQGWMTRCLLALSVPLDRLECPTMVVGFQNGNYNSGVRPPVDPLQHHRTGSVHINMFKEFHRPLRSVLPRLANIQTSGGTPMADGIQFGLHALKDRPEKHRVVFIITDGAPDGRHTPVIRWQQRIAKESGIHIVGIGVGMGARRVCSLFDDHVWVPTFGELPNPLLVKLSMLINPTDRKHQKPLQIGGNAWGAQR